MSKWCLKRESQRLHTHIVYFLTILVPAGNFTINARLRVCLIDFGSVRLPYDRVSGTGWTVEYISPECAKYLLARLGKRSLPDQSQITTKVDMFSFAMTMGFVRTGEHLLIRLVAKDCKYQKGQRDRLRINLIEQVIVKFDSISFFSIYISIAHDSYGG